MKIKRESADTISVNGMIVWARDEHNVALADIPRGTQDEVLDFLREEN